MANLRGGGSEYGEEWHRAGMRENKQNVFDDFIAVLEKLKKEATVSPHGGVGATAVCSSQLLSLRGQT